MDTLKQWVENLPNLLKNLKETKSIIIHEQTEVAYGWDEDFDKEYCDKNNIPYFAQVRDGGTIICAKGNIGIAFVYNNTKYKKFMLVKLLDDLCEYFKSKGLNSKRDRNDILIDDYKVASGCGYNLAPDFKWTYEGVQISINQDIELIRKICKKSMLKEPKALSDYRFTTNDLRDWVNKWFEENTYEV